MHPTVCVDASLILRILVPEPLTEQALALWGAWQQEQRAAIAPSLLAFEVTASLRRYVYLKRITPAQGEQAFAQFLQMEIHLSQRPALFRLAWELAKQFNQSRAYDFWTADRKLYTAVRGHLPWVHWVGETPA
ncbi:MAG: hypothetical protein DCC57_06065 [Chloroflexi bacterium]|nr:MAG: hypothetical protein DCC57_06065 [Chloroflexota bacterium]